jgi:hypothetical protein
MAVYRAAILTLEARGIALFARLHVVEKLQVDVGAATLQLGQSIAIHLFPEIRRPLEPFQSPDRFIDALIHQVQGFKQMGFPHGKISFGGPRVAAQWFPVTCGASG